MQWNWGSASKPYMCNLVVGLDGKPPAEVLVTDQKSAEELQDAIATLVLACGRDPFRGNIGALLETMTPEQEADSGIGAGLLVCDIHAGGPAEKAGIRFLDIVAKVNGTAVSSVAGFRSALRACPSPAVLEVRRLELVPDDSGGMAYKYVSLEVEVTLAAAGAAGIAQDPAAATPQEARAADEPFGSPGFRLGGHGQGPEVIQVFENSPAARAGIKVGDIIMEVGGRNAGYISMDEILKIIGESREAVVTISIWRKGAPAPFEVKLTRQSIP